MAETETPSFREAFGVWTKIGVISFGGPAGQIALMHRMLVDERKWIDEQRFLTGLNFCMLLPGPEAMQLATYIGWRMHGVAGGLAAGLMFVLPGAALMLALALAYAAFGQVPVAEAVFTGIKAAVLAIVVEALLRVAKKALKVDSDWLIAAAAFVAIFFLRLPYPVIILAAAVVGLLRTTSSPAAANVAAVAPVPLSQTLTTIALWLAIWIVPLAAIAAIFGSGHVLTELAWFFSKLAIVTFGGAYAVLAYMAQEVVEKFAWLKPGEMLDALGLAETTPGPLILVTQFVGTLAAWREGGGSPVLMGILGALVTTWATFAPCFLWIFAGAPYIERLNQIPWLKSVLAAITAAVVGVILNLTVWFALHTLFRKVGDSPFGPITLHMPDWSTLNIPAAVLSALAFILLFAFHRSIMVTLAVCGLAALGWQYVSPA